MVDKETGKVMVRQRDWSEGCHVDNNIYQVEYEIPHGMSAWIIGAVARVDRLVRGAKVEVKASGPVVDILEVENTVGHSTIRQRILFHKHLKRIDFRVCVDWQEQSDSKTDAPMLKVSFMPELTKPSKVTWDIPFGNVTRVADGVEFAAQKWIDVSDDDAGFSLLNDSKYGFSANGNTIAMTCIRTSCSPDPIPDRGSHEFNYALVPHAGGWKEAQTVRAAAGFNSPLVAVPLEKNPKGELPSRHGWIDLESDGAIVTCFKKAEGSNALIVRIQETRGETRPFALKLDGIGARRVEEVSIVEDKVYAILPLVDNVVSGKLGPYEVKTCRIWR
jgi:alpha-mannosidase